MGIIFDKLEQAKEVQRLVQEGKAKTVKEALEIVKAYYSCDQTESNKHRNTSTDIISQNCDIDGEEIYDIELGKTIMDLDYFQEG